ncbi:glycosyltransferase involved in cell wall biosynthesis [Clostridium algifaecis]|uniref:Glycosyltransferase involved in cell wall biosynthesis n=1 Tax=Clostridium algifaecis TaxID=1472040 RepID=A0ABS4KSU5_9CLOT|nr:glycosyltransferase [Clostridium algifaecis]MBP2032466.1 glycosyltransferase involved in cell wall biosynthesis [Clostridium algifaecis]
MKVLIISHMYPSNFNSMSGIFVFKQAKALVQNGCEVKVVSPVPWTPFPFNVVNKKWKGYNNIPDKDVIDSIEVYYPRYLEFPRGILFQKSGYFMAKGIKNIIRKIYKNFKFDLIHSNVALPDGYSGMLINNYFNVPHIVTIHGQDFQNTINKNKKCREAVFRVLNSADKIITVSNKLKNIVKEQEFCYKINVINNGIDDDCFENNIENNIENIKKNEIKDKIKILSVSNLKKTKGIQINLRAISQLKGKYGNIQYDIIGEGEFEIQLRKLVRELGLEDVVNFLGKKEHDEVLKSMSDYDIFSLPSYNEGFGTVYIEAMSKRVAVIGVEGEGIEDAIKNGYNGFLVKREDVTSLIDVLDMLIKDDKKRNIIAKNGRNTVIKYFTWNSNAKKVIKLYEKMISTKKQH